MLNRRSLFLGASFGALLLSLPSRAFAAALGYPRLIEGPMIGPSTAASFSVWNRASGPFGIQIEYATDRSFTNAKLTPIIRATADDDFVTVITVGGLQPATDYHYRVLIEGEPDRHHPQPFRTATAPATPSPLRIAFGSCARIQVDSEQRIFSAIAEAEPDLFLWLGDNIYADTDQASVMSGLYQRQRSIESLQPLNRSVPQLAIWDDHDFGYNDSDKSSPIKAMATRLFKRYWANPAYGLPDAPGCFFKHSLPGVDFFMLDGRSYRDAADAADGPTKTMLGKRQMAWLKAELKKSSATFKILASGTGWSAAENKGDSWARFLNERNALFDFIRDQKIEGVFGISGDVHMGELNCVPRSEQGGYDFYDLASSGLAQIMNPRFVDQSPEVRLRQPFVGSNNFGVLDFEFGPVPTVRMNVHNIIGAPVWDPLIISASDLKNGVTSWTAKIDEDELERRNRVKSGGNYYTST